MARKVRRGGKLGSRLKALRRSEDVDAVAAAQDHAPIDADLDDDAGGGGLTMSFGRWSGRKRPNIPIPANDAVEAVNTPATDAPGARATGFGGVDGFDAEKDVRTAYQSYMRGQIEADAKRFESLRQQGAVDKFDPELAAAAVESQGHFFAANHMVRLFEHWLLESPDRLNALEKASTWLAGFTRNDMVKKVLAELESKPIRDIYPLEVMMQVLEDHPTKLPGVAWGSVFADTQALQAHEQIYAGHAVQLPMPDNMRIKSFALLGGGRPGYEFFPSPKPGFYTLLVDTPGNWDFGLFAVRTEKLGKMDRELPGGVLESFTLHVAEMGRKTASP